MVRCTKARKRVAQWGLMPLEQQSDEADKADGRFATLLFKRKEIDALLECSWYRNYYS